MPIYEYRCQACGHELEQLQRMNDPALTECPACGRGELRRLISAAGFRLKGGGWYETDFKQGNKRNLADSGDAGRSGEGAAKGADSAGGKSGSSTDSGSASSSGSGDSSGSTGKKSGADATT